MKKSIKILTAISALFPIVFGVIYYISAVFYILYLFAYRTNIIMLVFLVLLVLLQNILISTYLFNIVFDILYVVKSGKFSSKQRILWIVLLILLGIIVAPIFWCIYLRPLSPDEPMFPQKE